MNDGTVYIYANVWYVYRDMITANIMSTLSCIYIILQQEVIQNVLIGTSFYAYLFIDSSGTQYKFRICTKSMNEIMWYP